MFTSRNNTNIAALSTGVHHGGCEGSRTEVSFRLQDVSELWGMIKLLPFHQEIPLPHHSQSILNGRQPDCAQLEYFGSLCAVSYDHSASCDIHLERSDGSGGKKTYLAWLLEV